MQKYLALLLSVWGIALCIATPLAGAGCDRPIMPHASGLPGPETGRMPIVSKEFDEVLRVAAETYFNPRNERYVEMARNEQAGKTVAVVGHVLGKQRDHIAGQPLNQAMYDHWHEEYRQWMQGIVDYRCYHRAPYVPREQFWTQAREALQGRYEDRINQIYGPRHIRSGFDDAFKSGGHHAAMLLGRQHGDAITLLGQRAPATDHLTPPPATPVVSNELPQSAYDCLRCRSWIDNPMSAYNKKWYYGLTGLPFPHGQNPRNLGGNCKTPGQTLCCRIGDWYTTDRNQDHPPEPPPYGRDCFCVDKSIMKPARAKWSRAPKGPEGDRFCW